MAQQLPPEGKQVGERLRFIFGFSFSFEQLRLRLMTDLMIKEAECMGEGRETGLEFILILIDLLLPGKSWEPIFKNNIVFFSQKINK